MGAVTFQVHADGNTVAEAYDNAVADAVYWHGHAPYSGTIKEKAGFTEYPVTAGATAEQLADALRRCDYSTKEPLLEFVSPAVAEDMFETFDDKWGPAVALRDGDGWLFCGWASC